LPQDGRSSGGGCWNGTSGFKVSELVYLH